MSTEIRGLSPAPVWSYFTDINAIPRASKKEQKIREFMMDFARSLSLQAETDGVGNICIRKPASSGKEHCTPVILQSHLDMVHQKNADTVFDFDTQGIDMFIDGEWVRARGTTLGADNGMGVAAIMAILASENLSHPPLEALFTIDEETGMTGALGLQGGWLQGRILLNLDTEEDDEFDIGCAGGMDVTATLTYTEEPSPAIPGEWLLIQIKGLKGGHSGIDIHLGRGNANKWMGRLLYGQRKDLGMRLSSIDGGSLRNAIPRECQAVVFVPAETKEAFLAEMRERTQSILSEYTSVEPSAVIEVTPTQPHPAILDILSQDKLCNVICAAHNGVYRMSPDIDGLVEASNNVARVLVGKGEAKVLCLTRSSVESTKWEVARALEAVFSLAGCDVVFSGDYPGWTPNIHSPALRMAKTKYSELYGEEPKVVACHAGLECGILGRNYPGLDMLSFGPTIRGAHSPDECVNIASVEKFWTFLTALLRYIA